MTIGAGEEWIVDAFECDPDRLRGEVGRRRLAALLERIVVVAGLDPVEETRWHVLGDAGGVTGFALLEESHFVCRSFPATDRFALTLFSARPREAPAWKPLLLEFVGARDVRVRRFVRGLRCTRPGAPVRG